MQDIIFCLYYSILNLSDLVFKMIEGFLNTFKLNMAFIFIPRLSYTGSHREGSCGQIVTQF